MLLLSLLPMPYASSKMSSSWPPITRRFRWKMASFLSGTTRRWTAVGRSIGTRGRNSCPAAATCLNSQGFSAGMRFESSRPSTVSRFQTVISLYGGGERIHHHRNHVPVKLRWSKTKEFMFYSRCSHRSSLKRGCRRRDLTQLVRRSHSCYLGLEEYHHQNLVQEILMGLLDDAG